MDYFAEQDRNSMIERWLSTSSNSSTKSVSGFVEIEDDQKTQIVDHNHNNGL